jgi:hypothetical protein
MEPVMAHLIDKSFVERANAVLLLGILWSALAVDELETEGSA